MDALNEVLSLVQAIPGPTELNGWWWRLVHPFTCWREFRP